MQETDPNRMLEAFNTKLIEICREHIPEKGRKKKSRSSIIPRDRKILMKKRSSLNRQLNSTQNEARKCSIREKINCTERKIKDSHINQRYAEESKAVSNIKHNPKYFFSYCKKYSKTKTQIGPLKTADGTLTKQPKETCQLLREQYNSVFSLPRTNTLIEDPISFFSEDLVHRHPCLTDIEVTVEDIERAIQELKHNAAAGPDGVPAILLRKCSQALARPIYRLWQCSLDSGVVPDTLKAAKICPIYKGGDRSLAKNYRPVALTSHLVKIMEKCARNKIMDYLETNNLYSVGQHGFRKGRSCLSKLLSHYDWVLQNLAEGRNVDVVFLDFAKAFDKVDHGILLRRVKELGITGKLGRWMHSFLTGRVQTVVVDGHKSEEAPMISGVPQGSVLGPLLFLIYMGDIGIDVGDSVLTSFADDTSVSRAVTTTVDVMQLQQDLDTVYSWATASNMRFNEEKFELLRHGTSQVLKETTSLQTERGQEIIPKQHVKCLGVHISEDCSFHHHITETIIRAKGMAAWVLRTFATRETEVMLTLWKVLVQPILDYCSQLWSPHKRGDTQRLEEVPRSFTRQIWGLKDASYWERLKILGLYSQQRRRDRYRAIYIWKVLEQQVPDPSALALQPYNNERTGRKCVRRSLPPSAPPRIKTLLASSLTHDGPRTFNALPREVRDITGCSVDRFKAGLDRFLSTVPDEPAVPGYTASCRSSNSLPDQVELMTRDARSGSSGGPPRL